MDFCRECDCEIDDDSVGYGFGPNGALYCHECLGDHGSDVHDDEDYRDSFGEDTI